MKVVMVGKGGCGKSTVTAMLARALRERGFRILVIDTDESNFGLHSQLGLAEPKPLMDHLGGKKEIGGKLMEFLRSGKEMDLLEGGWNLDSIPEECLSQDDGVSLLQIGKMHHFGEGCACPMGVLSREFLKAMNVAEGEIVLVDTEAGVEHIGRGLEGGSDLVLAVLDPSYESIRLSGKISEMLSETGKPVRYVINRIEDENEQYMRSVLDEDLIVAVLPYDKELFQNSLRGEALRTAPDHVNCLVDMIVSMAQMGN